MQEAHRGAEQEKMEALEQIARKRKEMQAEEESILEHIHRDQALLMEDLSTTSMVTLGGSCPNSWKPFQHLK